MLRDHALRLLACLCLCLGSAAAQTERPLASAPWLRQPVTALPDPAANRELGSLLAELADLRLATPAAPLVARLMGTACRDDEATQTQLQVLEARARQRESDRGVRLEAGARVRTLTDEGTGASAYAGLAWELLREGRSENLREAELLRGEAQLTRALVERGQAQSQLACRHTRLLAASAELRARLLGALQRFLAVERSLATESYFGGTLYLDELIRIDRDLERVRQRALASQRYAQSLPAVAALSGDPWTELPLVDVDLDRLVAAIRQDEGYERLAALERRLIARRQADWDEARLRLYVRQGVGSREADLAAEKGLTLGLAYSRPIFADPPDWHAAEQQRPAQQQAALREAAVEDTLRAYLEFQAALDDGLKLHAQREQVLERLRRTRVSAERAPEDGAAVTALLSSVRDLLETEYELNENKQRLYVRLLSVLSAAAVPFRDEFVRPVASEQPSDRARGGDRALYVWSAAFNREDNRFLLDLLQAKRFGSVVVSAGRANDDAKLADFAARAKGAGLRVELMLARNDWARPEKHDEALRAAQRLYAIADHVHLDVEPQALPDYKARRDEHLRALATLFSRIAQAKRPGQELSASLTVNLREAEIPPLVAPLDRVYVMAYESDDPARIERRLQPFLKAAAGKLVVALRAKDFADEAALERTIRVLRARLGIGRFALHDLEQLNRLYR